jgi:hypothetical protein
MTRKQRSKPLSKIPRNRHSKRSACGAEPKNLDAAHLTDAVQAFSTSSKNERLQGCGVALWTVVKPSTKPSF